MIDQKNLQKINSLFKTQQPPPSSQNKQNHPNYGKSFNSQNFDLGPDPPSVLHKPLIDIYKTLFANSKPSEFSKAFQSNPSVLLNLTEDLKQDESLWHIIDKEQTGELGLRLHEGAVLRFGKQRVEVKMISTPGLKKKRIEKIRKATAQNRNAGDLMALQEQNDLINMCNNNYYSNHAYSDTKKEQEIHHHDHDDDNGEEKKCWICLEGETEDNPFARNLCKCGHSQTRHVDCLVQWLSKKCERTKMGFITFFDFSKMVCDICKDQFPSVIEYKDTKKMFIDFDPSKIKHSFLVLNIYRIDDNRLKGVALLEFKRTPEQIRQRKDPKVITFGRNDKNDINFKGN